MGEEAFGRRVPFALLEDIKSRFQLRFGEQAQTAIAYECNADFEPVLQERMDWYNRNPQADAVSRARGDLAEVKDIMLQNIEKAGGKDRRLPGFCPAGRPSLRGARRCWTAASGSSCW